MLRRINDKIRECKQYWEKYYSNLLCRQLRARLMITESVGLTMDHFLVKERKRRAETSLISLIQSGVRRPMPCTYSGSADCLSLTSPECTQIHALGSEYTAKPVWIACPESESSLWLGQCGRLPFSFSLLEVDLRRRTLSLVGQDIGLADTNVP